MDLFAKGWECPKCGAVMSPTTGVCVNCRGGTQKTMNDTFTADEIKHMTMGNFERKSGGTHDAQN